MGKAANNTSHMMTRIDGLSGRHITGRRASNRVLSEQCQCVRQLHVRIPSRKSRPTQVCLSPSRRQDLMCLVNLTFEHHDQISSGASTAYQILLNMPSQACSAFLSAIQFRGACLPGQLVATIVQPERLDVADLMAKTTLIVVRFTPSRLFASTSDQQFSDVTINPLILLRKALPLPLHLSRAATSKKAIIERVFGVLLL